MNSTVETISVAALAVAFIPTLGVVAILYRWSLDGGTALYALVRMVLQLVLVGYALGFVFETDHAAVVLGVLALMLMASSWIALRPLAQRRRHLYPRVLAAIALGGLFTLLLATQLILDLAPWFEPRYVIPLAGMIFANAMNTVSLAAERFEAETGRGVAREKARTVAFEAALIPLVNSLFAVGLVPLPGMMTGQILAGVSPLIAARYQILVMCMIFGAAGLASACFLTLHAAPRIKTPDRPANTLSMSGGVVWRRMA